MGDLAVDTAVTGSEGRYFSALSQQWEVWGPAGGYVAAVALRGAQAHTDLPRPVSIQGHFLGVGEFAPVEIIVETLRRSRRAESMRVTLRQGDATFFEALVWAADALEGLTHEASRRPNPPPPESVVDFATRVADAGQDIQPHPYFANFEHRPVSWVDDWDNSPPGEPIEEGWWRYRPNATFDDPWVDACRGLVLVDMTPWPAACHAYRSTPMDYYAPSIDISCAFHTIARDADYLYAWAESPVARDGLVGGRAEVWTEDGRLVASGGANMLCRPAALRPDDR